jgi:hypothetical protein
MQAGKLLLYVYIEIKYVLPSQLSSIVALEVLSGSKRQLSVMH